MKLQSRANLLTARYRPYLALAAVLCAALAQVGLDRSLSRYAIAATLLYAAALGLFLLAARELPAATFSPSPSLSAVPRWRSRLGLLALPAAVLAWQQCANNRLTLLGAAAWLGALALLLYSAWQRPLPDASRPRLLSRGGLRLEWSPLALLAIIGAGAFLRLWHLDAIPAEMGCDLPHNYNNISLILSGQTPVFFPSWPGREGLFFYLAALPAAWLGLSHYTIKLTSALLGIAAIPVLYALGRELYSRRVGLIAAALYAASLWAVITSRVGLRMVLVPLLLSLTWLNLVRGLNQGGRWHFALAGLCLGLGLHTYNAFMVVPALLAVWLLVEVLCGRGRRLWERRVGLLYLALTALAAWLPLARFIADSPASYLLRVSTRLTASEMPLAGSPLLLLLQNYGRALLMFNVSGDSVPVNNIAGFRELGFVSACFFALGIGWLVRYARRGYNLGVLAALLVMLLPSALALAFPLEVPNAGRAIGALPPALLAAAVALERFGRALTLRRAGPSIADDQGAEMPHPAPAMRRRWLAWGLVAALLAAELGASVPLYFDTYRANLPAGNYSISLAIARTMDDFAGNGTVFIKTQANWYDGNAVRAQLRRLPGWDNEFWDLDPFQPPVDGPPGKVLVILHPRDTASLEALRTVFRRSADVAHYDDQGQESFIAFYGER